MAMPGINKHMEDGPTEQNLLSVLDLLYEKRI